MDWTRFPLVSLCTHTLGQCLGDKWEQIRSIREDFVRAPCAAAQAFYLGELFDEEIASLIFSVSRS